MGRYQSERVAAISSLSSRQFTWGEEPSWKDEGERIDETKKSERHVARKCQRPLN